MDCPAIQRDGEWWCPECRKPFRRPTTEPPRRTCWTLTASPATPDDTPPHIADVAPRIPGPGDCLHRLILDAFGIAPEHGCGCEDWIAQMNAWGVAGCRANRQKIVDRMIAEAKKRHWHREGKPLIVNAATRLAAATSWGLAYAARYCGGLVDQAIARAAETPHDGTTGSPGV